MTRDVPQLNAPTVDLAIFVGHSIWTVKRARIANWAHLLMTQTISLFLEGFALNINELNQRGLFSFGFATDTIVFTNQFEQVTGSVHVTIETSISEP
jgi:hypothetical protein